MKRSQKHRKYKKHLEDGSTPPRTSRRNFNKVLDDSTSTSTDDQQEFYKLLKHQKVQNNLAVRKRSSKSFTCADEHLDSSNVEVQVSDNTSHINTTFQNQDIEYNFENFEEPVPMDIRLHQSTDCETMDASIYELNNTFCEESESEEEFCQTQNKGHFLELEAKLNCGEFDKTINAHFTGTMKTSVLLSAVILGILFIQSTNSGNCVHFFKPSSKPREARGLQPPHISTAIGFGKREIPKHNNYQKFIMSLLLRNYLERKTLPCVLIFNTNKC